MDQQPETPEDNGSLKKKLEEQISHLHAEEKMEELYSFTRTHTLDTVAYAVLIAGIIISIFSHFWGGILIGVVAGLYFTGEVMFAIKHFSHYVEKYGVFKTFVLGGVLFGLFIARPMLFVALAATIGIKLVITAQAPTAPPKQ